MSDTITAVAPSWRDYLELCKPRVVALMLVTAAVGMFLAVPVPGLPPLDIVVYATLGIALVASSAAVVNHVADAQIDARMARTQNRPIAQGRVAPVPAIAFSALIGIAGMAILTYLVNPLTAWLNLASWVGYGLIYTLFLKRATPQNIVIGGLFGATPPLFGWVAVTGSIETAPLLLVLIIFVWTPPHFWALALDRIEDYTKADVPMLPVTHGESHTRRYIFFYTLTLIAASLAPYIVGLSGTVYLVSAIGLGTGFLYWATALLCGWRADAAIRTFRYSIVYLGGLFLALLVDHYTMQSW